MKVEYGEEATIREYPWTTRWLEGDRVVGAGNLILTNRRLVFLNRVELTPEQAESLRKLAGAPCETVMRYALKMHGKNFHIPLTSLTGVQIGVFAWLPFPHLCLRVSYLEGKKQSPRQAGFQFAFGILQGLYKTELGLVWGWKRSIRRAMRLAGCLGGV